MLYYSWESGSDLPACDPDTKLGELDGYFRSPHVSFLRTSTLVVIDAISTLVKFSRNMYMIYVYVYDYLNVDNFSMSILNISYV